MPKAEVHDGHITLQRDLLTLDKLVSLTGWGRTKTYQDARNGTLPFPVLRHGRRWFVSRRAYEKWLDGESDSETIV